MRTAYRHDASSQLPEVHHQESSPYAYPILVQTPISEVPPTEGYYTPVVEVLPTTATARKRWIRWWTLALIGVFIAIITDLARSFIGQTIKKGRESGVASQAASPSPSACPNSTSAAIAPPLGAPTNAVNTIVIPDTGCDWPNNKERRRLAKQTNFFMVNYTTICNSGWPVSVGIIALWTLTPSDCVEACIKFNQFADMNRRNGDLRNDDLRCVGAGFVPSWTNQTTGARDTRGPPFNCYPKSSEKGIIPNDRASEGTEVVVLCLDGQCNGIGQS
ncbi:hypothetical protein BDV95DRAFT_588238 [Massariosphaeria phaeospora]|uniref:Uncharacterized protein n=1 Tax=Massariosphaeria phaeospora TaxID=100035 RepID=A0A7C8M155_9PLEO|nr:hypothetical protein BDV95DRAFT_588238 [Massariosphaeria phaeospora]